MNYTVKESGTIHGFCPPGYERVTSYSKKDGTVVPQHCRKVRVEGRVRAAVSGLYNEGMIAQEDVRLGFDSIVDSTKSGESNASKIKERADRIKTIMKEQEERKEEAKRREEKQ